MVFWPKRRKHDVLGSLAAHFDGEVNGEAHHVAEGLDDLVLELRRWLEEFCEHRVYCVHNGFGVLGALLDEGFAVR